MLITMDILERRFDGIEHFIQEAIDTETNKKSDTLTKLVNELEKANRIICNALQIMTNEQKAQWGRDNTRDGVDGEGVMRRNERDAAIAKAKGE